MPFLRALDHPTRKYSWSTPLYINLYGDSFQLIYDVFRNELIHYFIRISYPSSFHWLLKDSERLTNLVLLFSHSLIWPSASPGLISSKFSCESFAGSIFIFASYSLSKNKIEVFNLHFMARNYFLSCKRFYSKFNSKKVLQIWFFQLLAQSWFQWQLFSSQNSIQKSIENSFSSFWRDLGFCGSFFLQKNCKKIQKGYLLQTQPYPWWTLYLEPPFCIRFGLQLAKF